MEENKTARYNTLQVLAKLFLVVESVSYPLAGLVLMIIALTNDYLGGYYRVDNMDGVTCFLFGLLTLAWCIPMTIHYFHKTKKNEGVSLAFKICSFIFVSRIAGILMICDNKN